MSATVALTQELIARASVTPDDAGCQELIAARLAKLGCQVERLRYGEVDNLWAVRGQGEPVLCFAGHTDVVPTGPLAAWHSHPFKPEIRDGVLYGRGAADMKSGIAAMVTATEAFVAQHPGHRGSIAFLITSDEEGPSIDGTRRVVETLMARGVRLDWCIVAEPSGERQTGDTLKIGRRGSLSGHLTVHGVQGHVAYPKIAENPVHSLAPALAELTAHTWDHGNEHFPPTTFQVSNLNAGTGALNVIPGELQAHFNLRFAPVHSVEALQVTIEDILRKHRVRYSLEWQLSGAPFYCPPGKLARAVSAAVKEVSGLEAKYATTGGTSDGRFLVHTGAEVVELGVPNPSIHKVNECARLADIDALHAIYVRMLHGLLV
ncbi:MAG TPA: succinyl-diaminopimelate desuccinylase [Steroidobacteraceae bacterium]|nr:succinyl-diaminopimelate desuccinylase [Steroidobacteraceae bacterium]